MLNLEESIFGHKKTFTSKGKSFLKASDGNRTRDLLTTNEVRYRLCHASLPLSTYLIYYNNTYHVKEKSWGFYLYFYVIK